MQANPIGPAPVSLFPSQHHSPASDLSRPSVLYPTVHSLGTQRAQPVPGLSPGASMDHAFSHGPLPPFPHSGTEPARQSSGLSRADERHSALHHALPTARGSALSWASVSARSVSSSHSALSGDLSGLGPLTSIITTRLPALAHRGQTATVCRLISAVFVIALLSVVRGIQAHTRLRSPSLNRVRSC